MQSVGSDRAAPYGQVGSFTYTVADGAWTWTDGVYLAHGYRPREVPASTEVLMRHKHPEDRSQAQLTWENAIQDGQPFSCYHRIIDRHERIRFVLSVGHGVRDAGGAVSRLEGFLVDLTQVRRDETQAEVETALERIGEHRAVIEQAKGMVMVATGCGAQAAFEVLRAHSQHLNTKLHEVARRLVEAAAGLGGSGGVVAFLAALADSGPRTKALLRGEAEPGATSA